MLILAQAVILQAAMGTKNNRPGSQTGSRKAAGGRRLGSSETGSRRPPAGYQASRKPRVSGQAIERRERTRSTAALFALFVVFAVAIVVRLYYIQVYAAPDLASIAQAQRQSEKPQRISARRGSILDRNGIVLATTIDTVSVYANTLQMKNPEATAFYVAEIIGGEPEEWLQRFLEAPKDASNVLLVRYADLDIVDIFNEQQEFLEKLEFRVARMSAKMNPNAGTVWVVETALSCINFDYEFTRVYPYGAIGAQIIGTVNDKGEAICGIELQYDRILAGQDGEITVELGRDGTPLPNGQRNEVPKFDGEDIIISIDIGLQEFVESELKRYGELGNTNHGSVTIVDGATGEIYAAASLPLYDRQSVTTEEIELGAMSLRGIVYPYEPGSTMKAVAATAALEAGVVSVDDIFYVPATLEIDEFTIKDWYTRNDQNMDLRHILANSSNIGMTLVGRELGRQELFDYYYLAGFYQPTHIDYVGLSGVGEPTYLTNETYPNGEYISVADRPTYWSDIHAANLTFGQGLHVTALQMASFYGALANGGVLYEPHFLISRPQCPDQPEYRSHRIMEVSTAETMTDLLESVMTDGTGVPAAVPGYRIAGKTGTAERAEGGSYSGDVTQSMVGYFADSDCDLVVMVVMDDAGLVGNAVAPKPLFASLMDYIANRYWIEPDSPQSERN